jgi:chromosome partitioning protein
MSFEETFFRLYRQGKGQEARATSTTVTLPAGTQRIAVMNQKGGCGKTTTAVNLSACLAELGCRVLLVDLDPQAHATLGLGLRGEDLDPTLYHALRADGIPLTRVLQPTYHANLKLIPSNALLASLQVELVDRPARERVLEKTLEEVSPWFSFVVLDCPPSLNLLTINALTAATHVLIPIQTHYFSLDGMRELFKTIELVQEQFNPRLEIMGILPTMFDPRTRMNRAMLHAIREHFRDKVFKTVIHLSSALAECPIAGQPVTRYAPQTRGAQGYWHLAEEVLQQDPCLSRSRI